MVCSNSTCSNIVILTIPRKKFKPCLFVSRVQKAYIHIKKPKEKNCDKFHSCHKVGYQMSQSPVSSLVSLVLQTCSKIPIYPNPTVHRYFEILCLATSQCCRAQFSDCICLVQAGTYLSGLRISQDHLPGAGSNFPGQVPLAQHSRQGGCQWSYRLTCSDRLLFPENHHHVI